MYVHCFTFWAWESVGTTLASEKREVKTMEAVIVGAALAGSFATAFWVQKAVLGAMFRAFERGKPLRP
jgi:hypothetical protein